MGTLDIEYTKADGSDGKVHSVEPAKGKRPDEYKFDMIGRKAKLTHPHGQDAYLDITPLEGRTTRYKLPKGTEDFIAYHGVRYSHSE